jgi:PRTRC genetic system protein B
VYGTSRYNSFPYQHPFVTLHEVVHDRDGARLAEGQLATPQMLVDLMVSLGRSVPVEILPGNVLVRTTDMIVWWSTATERTMFFSDRGGDPALRRLNAKRYPHPPLVFKASGTSLWIRALARNQRPTVKATLYVAPYWNCNDKGVVCTGSMRIPREKSVQAIHSWEKSFFQSAFSHANGVSKHTHFADGVLAKWLSLLGKKEFPSQYLVETDQTLAEFVNHAPS